MSKKVAVVILNWNGRKYLQKFLPAVIRHSEHLAEIHVADNASGDDSIDFLRKNHPEVKLIRFTENHGFTGGYNRALKAIDTPYYVLLNSDVEVTKGWLEPLLDTMEADANIAACQPKILSYGSKNTFEYGGAAGGYIDKYGYPFCRGRLFLSLEEDHGQYDDEREVFWASGACMFIRASLFHRAGGLDEDFFAHMEEIDLCWRLKHMDYKIMFNPHSTVYHIGGGTLPKTNPRKTYYNFRNNLSMLYKNLPGSSLPLVILARLVLDGVAGVKFLLSDSFMDFWAVAKAHFSFYTSLPRLHAKRKKINRKKMPSGVYLGNIVSAYFLFKKRHFSELDQDRFSH